MHFLAGARYACLACATRGIAPSCPSCGASAEVVDLSSEPGRHRWLLYRAPGSRLARGRNWFDPRVLPALPPGRRWLWLATRSAFVSGAAWALLSDFMPTPANPVAWMTHLLVATVTGGLAALAVMLATALVVFLAIGVAGVCAQLLSLAGDGSSLVARVTRGAIAQGAGRLRDRFRSAAQRHVMQAMLEAVERAFGSRLRIAAAPIEPRDAVVISGTVVGERTALVLVEERSGALELSDVAEGSLDVALPDGERIGVVMHAASIHLVAVPVGEQPVSDDVRKQLAWTDLEGARFERAIARRIGAGARVRMSGGVWSETARAADGSEGYRTAATRRVLTGTIDAPLWIEMNVRVADERVGG